MKNLMLATPTNYIKKTLMAGACAAVLSVAIGQQNYPPDVDDTRVDIATDGAGTAVVTWLGNSESTGGADEVLRARSTNFGNTWSAPLALFHEASDTRTVLTAGVAYAGNDTWVSTWAEDILETTSTQNIYVSRSVDGGRSWSESQLILTEQVYYINRGSSPNFTYGSRFGRSLNMAGSNKFDLDIASDSAGTIIVTFESSLLRSTDFGQTWSFEARPEPALDDSRFGPGLDLESRLAYCGNGKWVHAFARVAINPSLRNTYLYTSRSSDNGATWASPVKLALASLPGGYDWPKKYLGDMTADGNSVVIAYQQSLFFPSPLAVRTSNDAGANWSEETLIPDAVDADSGVTMDLRDGKSVFLTDRAGNIQAGRSLNSGTTWEMLPDVASDPTALETIPDIVSGPDGSYLAVFEVNGSEEEPNAGRHIQTARSIDNGSTWQLSSYLDLKVNAAQDWQLFE